MKRVTATSSDTDTNAAIAGALLGPAYRRTLFSLQWVNMILSCHPRRNWSKRPRPRAFWPVDALGIAERLLAL